MRREQKQIEQLKEEQRQRESSEDSLDSLKKATRRVKEQLKALESKEKQANGVSVLRSASKHSRSSRNNGLSERPATSKLKKSINFTLNSDSAGLDKFTESTSPTRQNAEENSEK